MSGTGPGPSLIRTSVRRDLLRRALHDAIDWQESFIASHDPQIGAPGCCRPGARCEVAAEAEELVREYRGQLTRMRAPQGRT